MYEKILLPVDEGTEATRVFHHASEIAHRCDAHVEIVHVADTNRDSVTVVDNQVVDALEAEGEQLVESASEILSDLGVDYDTDVVQGDPAETIVDYAERYDFDLIVMSTHGRAGLSRYLLGSVTEKVVRLSSVPVLTVRMEEDEELRFPYERVLVPTDGSDVAGRAAAHAIDLASFLGAGIHVLSVVEDDALGPDVRSVLSENEIEAAATEAIEEIVATAEDRGIEDVTTTVAHGSPADEILAAVEDGDADVVVMGTTGRRGIDRILLGNVAEKTVRSVPVPVITVS